MTLALIILIVLLLACVVVIFYQRSELLAERCQSKRWRDEASTAWMKFTDEQIAHTQLRADLRKRLKGTKQ